jgi:hypothetical protein
MRLGVEQSQSGPMISSEKEGHYSGYVPDFS